MSINKAILVGNVGKDPDIRYFDKESERKNTVATFTLATTERGYTLANGTQVPDRTEWHNIVCWRGLAELAEKYIRKGSHIYVEGKITTRSWEKDGITRFTTEILAEKIDLLGKKPEVGVVSEQAPSTGYSDRTQPTQSPTTNLTSVPGDKDDLPF